MNLRGGVCSQPTPLVPIRLLCLPTRLVLPHPSLCLGAYCLPFLTPELLSSPALPPSSSVLLGTSSLLCGPQWSGLMEPSERAGL